ncbi:histidine phosphatase family protein [Lederbergia citri]|uniref:Histidine phosphatase family protein n=1 Tax=Lederbergia citri TaxID=2833580 RepID=A0A942YE55_9BACI|nr:histidine phosphatase family protein [Lederbergia citri]MBS4193533.1 histidine phosphatase family protein [Lederbergia citri]
MNTIYLVRHGIKEKSVGDAKLSAKGIQQAEKTASFFRDKKIDAVFSSPLSRAKETAAIIATAIDKDINEEIGLRERANWGDIPNQSFDEFVELWDKCTRERDYEPPNGVSARQAGKRMEQFINECKNQYPDSEIIAVTHGGIITDFMVNVFNAEQLNDLHSNFIDVQSKLIPECSITIIRYDGMKYYIDDFAQVTHLLDK